MAQTRREWVAKADTVAAGKPVVVVNIENTNRTGGQVRGIRRSKVAEQSTEGPKALNAHPEASRVAPADAAGRGCGETRNVNVDNSESYEAKRKGSEMIREELVLDFHAATQMAGRGCRKARSYAMFPEAMHDREVRRERS